jgi:hypothetical protein
MMQQDVRARRVDGGGWVVGGELTVEGALASSAAGATAIRIAEVPLARPLADPSVGMGMAIDRWRAAGVR